MTSADNLTSYLKPVPLVAILRGLPAADSAAIVMELYRCGLRCIEIPLTSPDALDSIAIAAKELPQDCLLGAGTVLDEVSLRAAANAGAKLIVMPHCDPQLIALSTQLNLISIPGVATVTEAFTALRHGASALKLFPAESVPPSTLKQWRTVLPAATLCLPVGGIQANHMESYLQAGAAGFGLGAGLYQPGMTAQQVRERALPFLAHFRGHIS